MEAGELIDRFVFFLHQPLTNSYYYQLTIGCDEEQCDNPFCANSLDDPPALKQANEFVIYTYALELARNLKKTGICSSILKKPIPTAPLSSVMKMKQNIDYRKQSSVLLVKDMPLTEALRAPLITPTPNPEAVLLTFALCKVFSDLDALYNSFSVCICECITH